MFVDYAPEGSAISRALDPDWRATDQVHLLREIEHGVRVLAWQQTEDGHKKNHKHFPAPIPVTVAERKAAQDSKPPVLAPPMTLAQANEWLGEAWIKREDVA